jgi:hypothetical protein
MCSISFIEDLTEMLPAKFGSIWPSSFRGEDLFNISQSETRIALGSHICWPNGTKRRIFSPETPWPNGTKLGRKHLCKILYKASSYGSIWPTNMATKSNSFF